MNCFSEVLGSVRRRRRDAPLSGTVIKVACLQDLLQHLAGNTTKPLNTMGNAASEIENGSSPKKSLQWSSGCRPNYDEPPEFLVKLAKILVVKSLAEDNLDGITENVFLKYVCKANQPLGKRLFHYLITHWQEESPPDPQIGEQETQKENFEDLLSRPAFLSSANYLMGLMTDPQQLEFYIKVFAGDKEKIERKDVYELVFAAYQISTVAHHTCCLPDDILMAVVNAAMHKKESVNTKYLHSWVCQHCPRLVMWLHRYITHILTVGHRTIPDNKDEEEDDRDTPILDCPSKSSCVTLHPALIWLLTCTLPLVYHKQQKSKNAPSPNNVLLDPHVFIEKMISAVSPTHWVPLYNSENHGLSINRFQHHVFGYHSATIMFITAEGDNIFCLACDCEWKDSKHFWGGENCLCMHLTPEYKIVESGAKMMYFNVTSRGFPTGIQVGRDCTNRALTIDLNLSLVTYRMIPFKLHSIEVWGCGACEAKEAQTELKKREVRDVENRRKVKLNSSDWLDNPDRYLIELAGTRLSYAQYDMPKPGGASNSS
ncbi:uncharacterized protein LOC121862450 [Homarus americanus]|uniref:Restriction of telomere capping protein 5-like n=1 Tax=Homarus americanus TaxID=6706 RepID=A0A8J5N2P2_HOMAM|nr:uncharacterized protein LOC121862450 [Homarus americanus]KAG7172107.1 Restriction of telomere capping protein 5-like [Homarus americanus]